jgi:hypothetical protein
MRTYLLNRFKNPSRLLLGGDACQIQFEDRAERIRYGASGIHRSQKVIRQSQAATPIVGLKQSYAGFTRFR